MKILMVNKFYYIKGGSETYYFALKSMLEERGHTVIDFSMKDERNFDSAYEKYFVNHVDYEGKTSFISKLKQAANIVYSFEAKHKFERLIKDERPDLVHLHIFQHQISPSILDVIKRYGIPTIYTAHDLKMLCLNYKMMHHNVICECCRNGKYINCALNKCVKDSLLKSIINVVEGYFHRLHKSYDAIDIIITPSNFYRQKFVEFGIDGSRIVHIPNFLNRIKPDFDIKADNRKYCLYFGRLSDEKGVLTLVQAAKEANMLTYIVGTGPLLNNIEEYISLKKIENVKMLGFKSGQELIEIVGNARAVILPSEWYENGPYSAIEALQLSRPIIGANIGGIPELINGNGFLFESGNSSQLADLLQRIEQMDDQEYQRLEDASYQMYLRHYTPEIHLEKIKEVYTKLGFVV